MNEQHIGYIKNGINLDHIPNGNALYVMKLLDLFHSGGQCGIGLNLPSKKLGYKDLIKIENRYLSDEEINTISLFCIGATLSTIKDTKIVNKITLTMPSIVEDIILCPNARCISREHTSKFIPEKNHRQQLSIKCHYCEQTFLLNEIKQYKI